MIDGGTFRYPSLAEPRGIITTFPEDGDELYGLQTTEDGPIHYLAWGIWLDYCIRRGYQFEDMYVLGTAEPARVPLAPLPTFTLQHTDGTPIDLLACISSLGDERWTRVHFVPVPADADTAAAATPDIAY